jgi:hypothetical protein
MARKYSGKRDRERRALEPGVDDGPQADFWPSRIYTGQFYPENTPMRILAWRGQVVEGFGAKSKRLMGTIADREALGAVVRMNDWNQYTVARGRNVPAHRQRSIDVGDDRRRSGVVQQSDPAVRIEIEATTKVSVRNMGINKLC